MGISINLHSKHWRKISRENDKEPENLSELTMYFINTFNELAFSSEVSAELPKINRSINSVSERERSYITIKLFSSICKGRT